MWVQIYGLNTDCSTLLKQASILPKNLNCIPKAISKQVSFSKRVFRVLLNKIENQVNVVKNALQISRCLKMRGIPRNHNPFQ